jgi:hypothetical protein
MLGDLPNRPTAALFFFYWWLTQPVAFPVK